MKITESKLRRIISEELDSGDDPVDRMMDLDPWTFDQDEKMGWRSLPDPDEQIKALKSYIEGPAPGMKKRSPDGKQLNKSIMTWHLGQALAEKGENEDAVTWMGRSLERGDLQWNNYVRSTIAFLRDDRPAFKKHSRGPNYNSDVLDRLRAGWGGSYSAAYSGD